MNFHGHPIPPRREAKIKYLDGDFQILREGDYVRCAVSSDPISLENLRYWSVDRQEAYKTAVESQFAEKRAKSVFSPKT